MADLMNIHEAKTHFSRLVEHVEAGEEILIARAGRPVARLVPLSDTHRAQAARRMARARSPRPGLRPHGRRPARRVRRVRLLLDAHALLWWLADDPELGAVGRSLIADPDNEVLVSAATVWEISIKRALGKLEAPPDLVRALEDSGFAEVPVTAADAQVAAALDGHHRDRFDRMLVAQAARLGATVVTRDSVFERYRTPTVPV